MPPFPDRNLVGKRILITRPDDASNDVLVAQLAQWGANVDVIPMIEIQPIPFVWPGTLAPQSIDWLFFTSKNAVASFFSQLPAEMASVKSLPMAVVGPATEQALADFGLSARFVSPRHDAHSAAQAFIEAYGSQSHRILWPCGNRAHQGLPDALRAAGMNVQPVTVYQTTLREAFTAQEQTLLQAPVNLLVFTSPSSVQAFCQYYAEQGLPLPDVEVACLGPKTGEAALIRFGSVAIQAEPHTLVGLTESIYRYFEQGVGQ